jgi:catechol 2,3-dioxygenase-like lactoylglutathione lyase family enzyme
MESGRPEGTLVFPAARLVLQSTLVCQPYSESSMIVAIDHVQITVPASDVERARAFYCGVLGLREIEKPDGLKERGGFWLEVGERQVHVGVEEGAQRQATKAHVAYAVLNVDTWRNKLSDAGSNLIDGLPIDGRRRFEFRDPFGNRVEFIEQAGGHSRRSTTSKVRALGEAALRVNDLAVMRRFYEEVFGLEPLGASDNGVLYRLGPGYGGHTQVFALFARGATVDPRCSTVDHIAFTIDRDDFDAEQARLAARGLEVELANHAWVQWRSLYLRDPEGNQIELVCYDPTVLEE